MSSLEDLKFRLLIALKQLDSGRPMGEVMFDFSVWVRINFKPSELKKHDLLIDHLLNIEDDEIRLFYNYEVTPKNTKLWYLRFNSSGLLPGELNV